MHVKHVTPPIRYAARLYTRTSRYRSLYLNLACFTSREGKAQRSNTLHDKTPCFSRDTVPSKVQHWPESFLYKMFFFFNLLVGGAPSVFVNLKFIQRPRIWPPWTPFSHTHPTQTNTALSHPSNTHHTHTALTHPSHTHTVLTHPSHTHPTHHTDTHLTHPLHTHLTHTHLTHPVHTHPTHLTHTPQVGKVFPPHIFPSVNFYF